MGQGWRSLLLLEGSAFQKNPGMALGMLQDPFPKGQNRRCPRFCGIMEKGAVGIQGQGLGGESMEFVGIQSMGRSSRIQTRGGGSNKSGKTGNASRWLDTEMVLEGGAKLIPRV